MKTELEKKDEEIERLKLLLKMSEAAREVDAVLIQSRVKALEMQLDYLQGEVCRKSELKNCLDLDKAVIHEGECLVKAKTGFSQGGIIHTIKCTPVGVVIPSEMYVKNGDDHIKVNSLDEAKAVMDSLKNAKITKTEDSK